MNKNAKIYIAGHTGMVGSAVTSRFKKAGYNNLLLKQQEELNLLNQNEVANFFSKERPEYVIFCAARVGGIKANMTYPAEFLYENLEMQNNVIWQSHLSDVKKFLFLGSSCIYPRNCQQPMKEEYLLDGKPEPTNESYSLAKIAGIKLCEKIYKEYRQNFIACMPTNIYGENDNFNPESSHVIPALIGRIHQAKINNSAEVVVWGSGKSRREFLHVTDLADAILWLMENYNDQDFLNIGTGQDISIKELALMIKDIVGFEGKLTFDVNKPDGMPKKLLDVSKINNLGWKYTIGLDEGMQATYKWFLNNYKN